MRSSSIETEPHTLRGSGMYERWGTIDVFDAELYEVPEDPSESILAPISKCLVFQYHQAFSAEHFCDATWEGLEVDVSQEALAFLSTRIRPFNEFYRDTSLGDRDSLASPPGRGPVLPHNGRALSAIDGHDFKATLFSIWLGKMSMIADLRKALPGTPDGATS